ncbi:MAG: TonB-dependent receptor plug domain-containing protein [Bacteroidota bacterium]
MRYITTLLAILLLLSSYSLASAQQAYENVTAELEGVVELENELAIGANIALEGTSFLAATDVDGRFQFSAVPFGNYTIKITYVGAEELAQEIAVKSKKEAFKFELFPIAVALEVATVSAKSNASEMSSQPISISSLDTKAFNSQALGAEEVLKRSSGVVVRQQGGLGSATSINLNGLTGQAVRIYYDGIPLQVFGGGVQINNIPVDALERMDVYKGVMPIDVGTDALGGGINLVPFRSFNEYLRTSYTIGSFNTHGYGVALKYQLSEPLYLRGSFEQATRLQTEGEIVEDSIIPTVDNGSFRLAIRDSEMGVFQDRATPDVITTFNPSTLEVKGTIDMSEGFVPDDVDQRYQRFIFRGNDVFIPVRANDGAPFNQFIVYQANLATNTYVGTTIAREEIVSVLTFNNFGQGVVDAVSNIYLQDAGNYDGLGIAARVNKILGESNEFGKSYVFEPARVLNPANVVLPTFNQFEVVDEGRALTVAKVNVDVPQEAVDIVLAAGGTQNLTPDQVQQISGLLFTAETESWCELDLNTLTVTPIQDITEEGVFGAGSSFEQAQWRSLSLCRHGGRKCFL